MELFFDVLRSGGHRRGVGVLLDGWLGQSSEKYVARAIVVDDLLDDVPPLVRRN